MEQPPTESWWTDPKHIPAMVIAVASLVLIPIIKSAWLYVSGLWKANRAAKLDAAIEAKLKGYVTTEDLEMQIDQMTKHTDALHAENRALLLQIKEDGKQREGLLLGTIKQAQEENRHNITEQNKAIDKVHTRVDTLLTLSGDRRQR